MIRRVPPDDGVPMSAPISPVRTFFFIAETSPARPKTAKKCFHYLFRVDFLRRMRYIIRIIL